MHAEFQVKLVQSRFFDQIRISSQITSSNKSLALARSLGSGSGLYPLSLLVMSEVITKDGPSRCWHPLAPTGSLALALAPLHNISKCPTESKGGYWAKFFFQKCGLAGGRGVPLCGRFSAWTAREGRGKAAGIMALTSLHISEISVKLLLQQCVAFCQGFGVEESDFRRRFKR